jgi:hypothetical protein
MMSELLCHSHPDEYTLWNGRACAGLHYLMGDLPAAAVLSGSPLERRGGRAVPKDPENATRLAALQAFRRHAAR